jgi:hypothetical protein
MHEKKIFFAVLSLFLFFGRAVHAFCPVCTIAVAGGVGLSRWLGVDDTVTGLWIGGLTVSMIAWTLDWFQKKNIHFYAEKFITIVGYYAIIVLPLYLSDIIGHPLNKFWGVDKLMLGIFFGSIFFLLGGAVHFRLKKKNGDKVYFPFQKVAFSVIPLIILSAVFYLITK